MMARINDGDDGSRKKLKVGTVYGNISTNAELLEARRKARDQQDADREKDADKADKSRLLRQKHALCCLKCVDPGSGQKIPAICHGAGAYPINLVLKTEKSTCNRILAWY